MTDNGDLTPRPAAAAWQPMTADDRVIVRWIAENADPAAYDRRALFMTQARDLKARKRTRAGVR